MYADKMKNLYKLMFYTLCEMKNESYHNTERYLIKFKRLKNEYKQNRDNQDSTMCFI